MAVTESRVMLRYCASRCVWLRQLWRVAFWCVCARCGMSGYGSCGSALRVSFRFVMAVEVAPGGAS